MDKDAQRFSAPEEIDGEALLEWHRVTAEAEEAQTLQHCDRAALVVYCQTWAMMADAAANLKKTGTIVKLPNGYPAASPFMKVYQDSAKLCAKLLTEFGLTPRSRGAFKYNNKTKADAATADDDGGDLQF